MSCNINCNLTTVWLMHFILLNLFFDETINFSYFVSGVQLIKSKTMLKQEITNSNLSLKSIKLKKEEDKYQILFQIKEIEINKTIFLNKIRYNNRRNKKTNKYHIRKGDIQNKIYIKYIFKIQK